MLFVNEGAFATFVTAGGGAAEVCDAWCRRGQIFGFCRKNVWGIAECYSMAFDLRKQWRSQVLQMRELEPNVRHC